MKNLFKLAATLGVSFLTAFTGSYVTLPSIDSWYSQIAKPVFTPPNWLFAPVWTLLFFLMGVSAFLVWRKEKKGKKVKVWLSIFGAQLVLNFMWSLLFFGFHHPLAAFIDILFLWALILVLIVRGWKISRWASILLIPYIGWVSFASLLNISIAVLN